MTTYRQTGFGIAIGITVGLVIGAIGLIWASGGQEVRVGAMIDEGDRVQVVV